MAGTDLDDSTGLNSRMHAVKNDCVTPGIGRVIERVSILIILIFRKGDFGVVAGEPIEESELLFFMELDAQHGRTAALVTQSSLDVFSGRDR